MIPYEVLNDSGNSSSSNIHGLIVFAQAQDLLFCNLDVVPVGPQFIINYTLYYTLL